MEAVYLVATGEAPAREVEALVHVGPLDTVVRSDGEMLGCVACAGGARPDLHLHAVGGAPASNI